MLCVFVDRDAVYSISCLKKLFVFMTFFATEEYIER